MRALRSARLIVLALMLLAAPAASFGSIAIGISVGFAPPVLPVYVQPVCPAPGYIWTPGYWAYDPVSGYYWVPGTWVLAPRVGFLWTPPYWGWSGGLYVFHAGYWGPHIGFYGGVNYGFGYGGIGFAGGYWNNGAFFYNRSVSNINTTNITNVYNKTVINNTTVNRVSYNGGSGGTTAQPTQAEMAAGREPHQEPTGMQVQHQQAASTNRAQWASVNQGRPAVAASPKPGVFSGNGVVGARGATGSNRGAGNAGAFNRPAARSTNSGGGGTRPLGGGNANTARSGNTGQSAPQARQRQAARPAYNAPRANNQTAAPRQNAAPRANQSRPATRQPATQNKPRQAAGGHGPGR